MKKLLVIDDEASTRDLLKLSLEKDGYTVFTAEDGPKGLELFARENPAIILTDLILMDIMMPVMDGIVATKKIREIESTSDRHVPIVAVTANALAGDRENCLAAGVDDYIAKPFTTELLVKKMRNLLA